MTGYDVIVVGGGHAGIEAAHAAARMGCRTALLTLDRAAIGRMSCNPAIGGLGKSHITSEVDALGGLQARATDATGIQFRTLNTAKGPAVRAIRVQCDKDAYSRWMVDALERTPNLDILEGEAEELVTEGGHIEGIGVVGGTNLRCRRLVLTTGTFLDALMHFGLKQEAGGRIGERAATRLSRSFATLGLEIGRLKTGTPARLARESIDFSKTELQPGDDPPPPFSFRTARLDLDQVPCYLTRTNEHTHDVIRGNLDRSPMYTGVIQSIGPRYCPSIEDKVVRFADKSSHQVFLEPETRGGDSIYPNGVSTSLPPDVQEAFLRTIPGLEQCRILRPGYAVEYTFVLPNQLHPTLEVKDVPGLFLAGQINGTSGYEEAAGQGILAGINAALTTKEEPPLVLRRDEAYIGVLVDDLITKVPREPYRMFTSRAEYRLLLRQDNADLRLADHARRVGTLSEREYDALHRYRETVIREVERLESTPLRRTALDAEELERLGIALPDKNVTLAQFLGRPGVTLETLTRLGLADVPVIELDDRVKDIDQAHSPTKGAAGVKSLDKEQGGAATGAADGKRGREGDLFQQAEREYLEALRARGPERAAFQIETSVQYAGYIKRQAEQIEQGRKMEETRLPGDLDYEGVRGLRKESATLLARHRPATLGQAARIAGVTPADIAVLQIHLRARRAGSASQEERPGRSGASPAARME